MLAEHSITADEYSRILAALGRVPSLTELGIYSVMWSEHCSYKSSRVHLKRLPTKSDRVVQGPGENAGIIDVGDGWACAFKIESHNHPSYIEPFQGAATGVGGILRDIFTMGARPLAVMDSLRFGPISKMGAHPSEPAEGWQARTTSQSSTRITPSSKAWSAASPATATASACPTWAAKPSSSPATAAIRWSTPSPWAWFARTRFFTPRPRGAGNPVIYVGAKTGRDGIHGATMASEEFNEGSEQSGPTSRWAIPSWRSCSSKPAWKPCRPAPSSASRTWARPASPAPPARWAAAAASASTSSSTSCRSARPA